MQDVAPHGLESRGGAPAFRPAARPLEKETPFTRAVSWLLAFTIALTLNGYPLAGSLAAVLNVESTTVTYPYRAISTVLTLMLGGMVLARGRFTLDPVMAFFLFAYAIRLYYDMTYTSLPDVERAMALFLSTVLVPFFTINICRYYYVNKRTLIAFMVVSVPSLMALFVLRSELAAQLAENARFGLDALNPISVGFTAVYCLLATFFLWLEARNPVRYLILAPIALIALYILLIANSRGPLIALLLCIAALSVQRGITLFLLGFGLIAGSFLFGDAISQLNIFERLANTGADGSSLQRIDRIASSVDLMMRYPLFGFGYIENKFYSYPHNLLIESGLALGYVGFAVMLFLQIRYGVLIWAGLRGNAQFVALLGITGLSGAWLSSTLWGSNTFWTPMTVLVALTAEQRWRHRRTFFRRGAIMTRTQAARPTSANLPGFRG